MEKQKQIRVRNDFRSSALDFDGQFHLSQLICVTTSTVLTRAEWLHTKRKGVKRRPAGSPLVGSVAEAKRTVLTGELVVCLHPS